MQGGSSGIGYGLKYQVDPQNLDPTNFSRLGVEVLNLTFYARRQDAYPMSKRTRITPASLPEPSVSGKKMRFVRKLIWFNFMITMLKFYHLI